MKASWIETQQIEEYLHAPDAAKVAQMQVRILCDADISEKVHWQKVAYSYVGAYARESLRQEIAQAQKAVFERPAFEKFRQVIQNIFS